MRGASHSPYKLSELQTDQGWGEFCSAQLESWLKNRCIRHRLINMAVLAENGLYQRQNRVLQEKAHCLLNDAGLGKQYWVEAFQIANNLTNKLWNSAINKTHFERLYNQKPQLRHLRVFGSFAWAHVQSELKRKGQDRARHLIFIKIRNESLSICRPKPEINLFPGNFICRTRMAKG